MWRSMNLIWHGLPTSMTGYRLLEPGEFYLDHDVWHTLLPPSSNSGVVFITLKPYSERTTPNLSMFAIAGHINQQLGAQHWLAVLLGESPAAFTLTAPAILSPLTAEFPVGKPEELLRRRPDVRCRTPACGLHRTHWRCHRRAFSTRGLERFIGFVATWGSDLGRAASEVWSLSTTLSWAAYARLLA